MKKDNSQGVDLAQGQAFLANAEAVEAYRVQHGPKALMTVMGDGGQFLVKDCDDERAVLISFQDFAEMVVARAAFDKSYFVTFLDEMPLYGNPSPELLANFNAEVEAYARAASLCA